MADSCLVPSEGIWKGTVHVSKAAHEATFEVFQSGGAWALLFGKPLLKEFCAVHEYGPSINVVRVPHNGDWLQLENHTPATVKQVDQQDDPEVSTIMEQPMDTDCEQKQDTGGPPNHQRWETQTHKRRENSMEGIGGLTSPENAKGAMAKKATMSKEAEDRGE
ncbi:hypothetical protein DXG01_000717 [Tephrocybe rancida]|nr:hypothetical protein DXG01_000717 [Tephrocybe rancida]